MDKGVILNSMNIFSKKVTLIRDMTAGPMFFYFIYCEGRSLGSARDIKKWLNICMGKVQ